MTDPIYILIYITLVNSGIAFATFPNKESGNKMRYPKMGKYFGDMTASRRTSH